MKYRLKKDTPEFKAGSVFTRRKYEYGDYDDDFLFADISPGTSPVPAFDISLIDDFDEWFEEIPDGQADDKLNDPLPRYENLIRRIKIYKATADSLEHSSRRKLDAYGGAQAALLDYAKWMSQVTKRIKDDGLEAVINKVALTIEEPLDPHTFEVALRAAAGCALRMIDEIDDANDIADLERTAEEARWDS